MTAIDGKPCKRCGFSDWGKNKQCKECARRYARARYHENPELARRTRREWCENNRERSRAMKRRWKQNNKESHVKSSMKWTRKNRDKQRQYIRDWNHRNKDKRLASSHKRRARVNSVGHEPYNFKEICNYYGNRCLCCGRDDVKLTIDHIIPVSWGGSDTPNNIQPLCQSCNTAKGARRATDYRGRRTMIFWKQLKFWGKS